MTAIVEEEAWEDEVPRVDITTPMLGGDDTTPLNLRLKKLANRARYLLGRALTRDVAINAVATPYTLSDDAWRRGVIDIVGSVAGQVVRVPDPELGEGRIRVIRNTTANEVTVTTPLGTSSYVVAAGARVLLAVRRVNSAQTDVMLVGADGVPAGMVTETGTQTLTNKTISGASNTISDLAASAINSGLLAKARGAFGESVAAANGVARFVTGAITWDAISGVVVGTTGTQTLTNKTISGASNTISNLAASVLTSGTVARNRGGFGADVSATTGVYTQASGTPTWKPNPSGAFVGDSDAQFLTNKSFSPSNYPAGRVTRLWDGSFPVASDEHLGGLTTVNATPTDLTYLDSTIETGGGVKLLMITAVRAGAGKVAAWLYLLTERVVGGTRTTVASHLLWSDVESGFPVSVNVTSPTVVQVTGAAITTIRWSTKLTYLWAFG